MFNKSALRTSVTPPGGVKSPSPSVPGSVV